MPAALQLIKEETTEHELLTALLQTLQILCLRYYSVIPAVESVLDLMSSQLKRWVKKNKSISAERCLVLQFVVTLLHNTPFFLDCLVRYSKVRDPTRREE